MRVLRSSGGSRNRSVGAVIASLPIVRTIVHNAFRIEDMYYAWRVRRARRRDYRVVVEPYTGYGSTSWVRVLARVQMVPPQLRTEHLLKRLRAKLRLPKRRSGSRPVRGWRAFTRINVANVAITVRIDGDEHRVMADRGGVIDINLVAALSPGWHTIEFVSPDAVVTEAPVFIVADDQRVGILSDIDDTVMVTALPRPLLAAWNTFVLDEHARTPTPGMNVFYERLVLSYGRDTAPFFYLSTGPWNVAPALARFLGRNLYPPGPLLLTDWGPTQGRLFRSGRDHKVQNLERLAVEFPNVKWILIGDDGQRDEEIYGRFARKHPENVLAVGIRLLSTGEAILAGGRSLPGGRPVSVPWFRAPDGAGLTEAFRSAGLLEQDSSISEGERMREEFLTEMSAREGSHFSRSSTR